MTPKEKANELFTTFRYALSHKDAPLGMYKDNIAIQCALIAVDEINKAIDFDWMEVQNLESEHRYWDKVEQEIKNL
jgi:hypothetical protein